MMKMMKIFEKIPLLFTANEPNIWGKIVENFPNCKPDKMCLPYPMREIDENFDNGPKYFAQYF